MMIASLLFLIIFHINFLANVEYGYRIKAGAHLDNGYDSPTLEQMRENFVRGRQGWVELGLKPEDCGRTFSWEWTQDWCMAFQYKYMDTLVARIDFFINKTKTENIFQFSDVYERLMANLRNETTRNGPIDWVAWPAYLLKHHFWYEWWGVPWGVAFMIFTFGVFGLLASRDLLE